MALRPFATEQGNFSLFMLLVFAAGWLLTYPVQAVWASGAAMALWGAFGAWRLAVISYAAPGRMQELTGRGPLAARLMATLAERESRLREEGHTRLHHMDIQLWFGLGCAYALWCCFNFIAPATLEAQAALQLSLNEFWQDLGGPGPEIKLGGNNDALIRQMSFLFCAGVASFTIHSFSYNDRFIRQGALVFVPVFAILACLLVLRDGTITAMIFDESPAWRGAGAGAATVLTAVMPDLKTAHSALMQRWIEQGIYGVAMVYALYLLPAFALLRFMHLSGRYAMALLGLAMLVGMALVDAMAPASGQVYAILFTGTAFIALAWGHSAYLRPFWAPRLELPEEAFEYDS